MTLLSDGRFCWCNWIFSLDKDLNTFVNFFDSLNNKVLSLFKSCQPVSDVVNFFIFVNDSRINKLERCRVSSFKMLMWYVLKGPKPILCWLSFLTVFIRIKVVQLENIRLARKNLTDKNALAYFVPPTVPKKTKFYNFGISFETFVWMKSHKKCLPRQRIQLG